MNKYGKLVLNHLLDKYERSVLSKQGSDKHLRIHTPVRKLFPKYDNSDYYHERLLVDEALHDLRELHIVSLSMDLDGIDDIELSLFYIEKAYQYANRTFSLETRKTVIQLLEQTTFSYEWLETFRVDMLKKLSLFQSVYRYLNLDDILEIKDIFTVLKALPLQNYEISLRKFSLAILKDSKRLEVIKTRLLHILFDYCPESFADEDDAFAYFNIMKNPGFLYLRGRMVIELNGQVIDLGRLKSPFSLMSENIEQLHILDIQDQNVLTIENLTSFYDTVLDNTLVIYLGGYHNALRRSLLTKIYALYPHLKFYHFGDIDAGGFYIYYHLKEKTQIPFEMLGMDIPTLQHYQAYCKSLTQNDRRRLEKLQEKYHLEVISYMLKHNCKLEQEIVNL